jgi:hypothetical protein
LIQLKRHVDAVWEEQYMGAKLDLSIRSYGFMPFGPLYQVDNERMFVGFYVNFESSAHAPMLVIPDCRSRTWKVFTRHFEEGWAAASRVVGCDERGVVRYATTVVPDTDAP